MYERDDYFDPEERQVEPELLDAIIADKRAKGQFRGGDLDYELAEDEAAMMGDAPSQYPDIRQIFDQFKYIYNNSPRARSQLRNIDNPQEDVYNLFGE